MIHDKSANKNCRDTGEKFVCPCLIIMNAKIFNDISKIKVSQIQERHLLLNF